MKVKRWPRRLRVVLAAAVFLIILLAFASEREVLTEFLMVQFGPALARCFAAFSWGAVGVVAGILIFTWLFGRFYCAAFCPLGIVQDVLGWLADRLPAAWHRGAPAGNHRMFRYVVAGGVFGLLAGGVAVGLRALDPFSRFGAMATAFFAPLFRPLHNLVFPYQPMADRPLTTGLVMMAALSLVLLAALVVCKRRLFCTLLCPVGTLLGAAAARGIFRLRLDDACVGCGQCAKVCPTDCIDPATRTLDNERCVRCMNCFSACRRGGVRFSKISPGQPDPRPAPAAAPVSGAPTNIPAVADETRREFFRVGAAAVVTAATGYGVAVTRRSDDPDPASDAAMLYARYEGVLPPGAGSPERFRSLCTGCLLCVNHCRGRVLRAGGASGRGIHLTFERGMCEFNCQRCGEVCPTGAIAPMTLEAKQRHRIGMVRFEPALCVAVLDRTDCGACAEHCPTGAVRMEDDGAGARVPVVDPDLCIGCGSCEFPCPVRPERAIRVVPVPIQVQAADPASRRRPGDDPTIAPAPDDDWLI